MKYGPYSPSRLDVATCGYAFFNQYVNKSEKRDSIASARGSAVHEVLERVTKKILNGDLSFRPNEVREWVIEAVAKYPAAYCEIDSILDMVKRYTINPPKGLSGDVKTELKIAVSQVGEYNDDELLKVPLVRPRMEEMGYDHPRAMIRGRIDILQIADDGKSATIMDHKTQPNVEDADTFQLGVYAWLVKQVYPFLEEIRTVLHFARYGKYSEVFKWDALSLYTIEEEMFTKIGVIESRTTWEATPHKGCTYCPFLFQCPFMRQFIDIDENGIITVRRDNLKIMGDTQKAVWVAGFLNIIEELVKVAKDELKRHVELAGPIAIPGKIYEFRHEEKINWDAVNKKLRDSYYILCDKHNIDSRTYMGLSETFSKHVWMSGNEAFVKDLADLFPRKVSVEFRGYKG